VPGLFVTHSTGAHELKGIAEPMELHRVERASGVRGRLMLTDDLAPLAGRTEELATLSAAWDLARTGDGRTVGMEGEAGVGKSRLVHEFRANLAEQSYTHLGGQCSPFRTATAFHPIIEMVESGLGLKSDRPAADRIRRVELSLDVPGIELEEVVPYLLTLLGLPESPQFPAPDLSPDLRREKTFEALCTMLRALSRLQPVLVVIEDLHWADRSTLDYLGYLVDRVPEMATMVLLTWRPGGSPEFATHAPAMVALDVGRLTTEQAIELAHEVGVDVSEDVIHQIVDRADGVPLFIEELIRWTGVGDESEIPMTLQDSLTARLDRLGDAKELARIGATIGREFSHQLLEAISEWDAGRVEDSVEKLIEAGILNRMGRGDDTSYAFRHALIHEAAYASQLRKDRRELHHKIASTLERDFRRVAEAQPELLALQWHRAESARKAAPLYIRAGEKALDRLANHEAVAHFSTAIELIETMEPGETRDELEIEARLAAGQPMAAVHGFGSPPVAANYARLEEIASALGTGLDSLPIRMALASYYAAAASFDHMRDTGRGILELAASADLPMLEAAGNTLVGIANSTVGTHAEAKANLERALELLAQEPDIGPASPTDPDLEVLARSTLAFIDVGMGQLEASARNSEEALQRAYSLDHAMTESIAEVMAGMLARLREDPEDTLYHAERTIDVAGRAGYPFWLSQGEVMRAWAKATQGIDSYEELVAGLQRHLDSGSQTTVPAMYWVVAEGMLHLGRYREAHEHIDRALEIVAHTGEVGYVASLEVTRARVILAEGGDPDEAVELLVGAMKGSREERRVWNDYQAARTLAGVYSDRGDQDGAIAVLTQLQQEWKGEIDQTMTGLIESALAEVRRGAQI
jgi:tetratricopeptide (TPR) repeat protein